MGTDQSVASLAGRYVGERAARKEFSGATPTTVRSILRHFVAEVGATKPAERVTRRDVEAWLSSRALAATTLRNRLSVVRHWFEWMVLAGYVKRNPASGVKGPRPPRYVPRGLDHPTVSLLLLRSPDNRARLVVLLMCQEGLRCGEVSRLEVGDIDRTDRVVLVRGKGGHQRVLPISDETWGAMVRYLIEHPANAGPLLRSYTRPGRALTPGYVSDRVNLWMRQAGVKQIARDGKSAHALRHTAATDMLRAGAHLRDVQAALGHQSLQTTQRYLPWTVGELRQAMSGRRYAAAVPPVFAAIIDRVAGDPDIENPDPWGTKPFVAYSAFDDPTTARMTP